MKRISNLLGAILLFLTACSKTETQNTSGGGSPSPIPSLTITVAPDTTWYAKTSVISWSSTNATSVSLAGGNISGTSGSFTTPTLFAPTTYSFTATGLGGSVTKQASVHVWSLFLTLLCWDDSLHSYAKWLNTISRVSHDGGVTWTDGPKDLALWTIYYPNGRRQINLPINGGTIGNSAYQISYSGGDTYINLAETYQPPNLFKIEGLTTITLILSQVKSGAIFLLTYTKIP